jgi:peptidoglycan/xylan/chitin deacetylase (PgdA/CDA1 family)
MIALTFDDGPGVYTSQLLDILDKNQVKATFFVTGNNFGPIDDPTTQWPSILQRMHASGHQIASHTWTHPDLNIADWATRESQMTMTDAALSHVLGFAPTYTRPPYGSCEAACLNHLGSLGYHIVNWNIDTKDYMYDDPWQIENAKQNFADALSGGDPSTTSFISLAHDIKSQTVQSLAQYMIETARAKGYRLVTVGECLGEPASNWYRYD